MITRPNLVQLYTLQDGNLTVDYMGAAEYEGRERGDSLRRIFVSGMAYSKHTIEFEGRELEVFLVGRRGFSFADYIQYIQQDANGQLRLHEPSRFREYLQIMIGQKPARNLFTVNVWHDLHNDVFWTMTNNKRKSLMNALEAKRKKLGVPTQVVK